MGGGQRERRSKDVVHQLKVRVLHARPLPRHPPLTAHT
jgi:hypothetical protein